MIKRSIIIAIIILIIALIGLMFFSNITGNVITGSSISQEEIKNNYFKIDDITGQNEEGNIKNAQNIS